MTPILHTKKWLSNVIIAHTFCPFAKREYDNNTIHYEVIAATDLPSQLKQVILHCAALDKDVDRETTLLIFPTGLADFEDYLDMLELATALLEQQGYEGIYQLASFHPKYRFEGTDPEDPSNYTNRSPYPMLHILREASVEAAVKTYKHPEKIPERNIQRTRELGVQVMKRLLADCYE